MKDRGKGSPADPVAGLSRPARARAPGRRRQDRCGHREVDEPSLALPVAGPDAVGEVVAVSRGRVEAPLELLA